MGVCRRPAQPRQSSVAGNPSVFQVESCGTESESETDSWTETCGAGQGSLKEVKRRADNEERGQREQDPERQAGQRHREREEIERDRERETEIKTTTESKTKTEP